MRLFSTRYYVTFLTLASMQFRPLFLCLPLWLTGLALVPMAQGDEAVPTVQNRSTTPTLERVAAIVERRRQEQGVPGVALVIVKDDKVVLSRGFGQRDIQKNLPVTPNTLFRIGSTTKAFTAMLAEVSVDEGKLSLDASPKRYLPDFRLRDPIADKEATLRDFLSHRSGLKRTDLAWSTGALDRAEVIRVAGNAMPTAPLRSLFQYNNVGYSIVGESIARAQGDSWENLVAQRIFAPLGMSASLTAPQGMANSSDFALSYRFNPRSRTMTSVPPVDTSNIAAATALVSNATDMGRWLRLMLNGGVYEGHALVSRRGYQEMLSPQTNIDSRSQYGLGWYLEEWRGHRVVRHGGTIGSFRTEVALMPDQNLGFVMLANASSEPLQSSIDSIIWSNLVASDGDFPEPKNLPDGNRAPRSFEAPELPATGRESLPDVLPPGEVPLAPLAGDDAPVPRREFPRGPGFTPGQGFPPAGQSFPPGPGMSFSEEPFGFWRDLIATYRSTSGSTVEIAWRNGRAVFVVPTTGKTYSLIPRGEDNFALAGLSDGFALQVQRDENGQVSDLALKQPVGNMTYQRQADFVAPFSSDELMAKVIEAAGGEANLRRHAARITTFEAAFENEGVLAYGTFKTKAPNSFATDLELSALGKPIGTVHEYFQGETGGIETNWQGQPFPTNPAPFANRAFDAQNALDTQQLLEWKTMFKSIVIKRVTHIGSQIAYVVEKTPVRGNPIIDSISTTSFRLLRRESPVSGWVRGKETYSDYRTIDGVAVPFRIEVESPRLGDILIRVKAVQFVADLPDSDFGPKTP